MNMPRMSELVKLKRNPIDSDFRGIIRNLL